ncbi:hypothetical protein J3U37_09940, partial [Gilliamella sp. B3172]
MAQDPINQIPNDPVKQVQQFGKQLLHGLHELTGLAVSHNRYTLTVDGLNAPVSVLKVNGEEQLNQ